MQPQCLPTALSGFATLSSILWLLYRLGCTSYYLKIACLDCILLFAGGCNYCFNKKKRLLNKAATYHSRGMHYHEFVHSTRRHCRKCAHNLWGYIVLYSLMNHEYNYYISYLVMLLSVISRQLLPPLVVITPSFVRSQSGTSLHVEDRYAEIKKCDDKI